MAHEVRQPRTSGVAARAIALVVAVAVGSVVWLCLPPSPAAAQGSQSSPRAVSQAEKARARFHNRLNEDGARLRPSAGDWFQAEYGAPGPNSAAYAPYVAEITCGADLVATARLLTSHSMLNESETAIFTDYRFHVEDVIRSTVALPQDNSVVLTLGGGTVVLEGRATTFSTGKIPFDGGTEYLVFLPYVPELEAYQLGRDDPIVRNRKDMAAPWRPSSRTPPNLFYGRIPFNSFVADVRAAAVRCS